MKACMGGVGGRNDGGAASSSPSNATATSINKSHLLTREFLLMMTLIIFAVGFPPFSWTLVVAE